MEKSTLQSHKRINRLCTFSFGLNFRRDSRFKRYPSWQYWNKCQNIIRIYWTKQFERKTQINRIYFFFCPLLCSSTSATNGEKRRVWCLSLQLKHKQNKKKWCCWFIPGRCVLLLEWLNFQFTRNFHKTTKMCLFFPSFPVSLRPAFFTLSLSLLCLLVSLTMWICSKCVWLSLFSLVRPRALFFSSFSLYPHHHRSKRDRAEAVAYTQCSTYKQCAFVMEMSTTTV